MTENAKAKIHNIELEQQLIAAVLVDNDRFHKVAGLVKVEHFYEPVHADIWRNIAGRVSKAHTADATTLKVDMETHEGLKQLGGPKYLLNLYQGSISGFAVEDYARELVEIAQKRELQFEMEDAEDKLTGGESLADVKAGLDVALSKIETDAQETSITAQTAAMRTLERISAAVEGGKPVGVQTGIDAIDRRLGGLFAPDLIILGGRPSMGKTSLATSIALRVAQSGDPVGIVSQEMDEEGLSHRFLSELSEVEYFKFRKAHELTRDELQKAAKATDIYSRLPIEIVPPGVREIHSVFSALRKIDRKYQHVGGLGLVVVDYLQLITARGSSQNERVALVSTGLKNMAKILGCPVLALSQLNRGVENRDNKRPMLSDIRDSGQIEQDADVVLFCYRDFYYLERQKPSDDDAERLADWEADLNRCRNIMEIITAKQRMGPIGSDMVGCAIATNRFWNLQTQEDIQF